MVERVMGGMFIVYVYGFREVREPGGNRWLG